MAKSIANFDKHLPAILEDAENRLTPIARQALYDPYLEHRALSNKKNDFDKQLVELIKHHSIAKQLTAIKGIGPITALALYACIGQGKQFKNARQLSAWIGLVPKQRGTGGKVQLGSNRSLAQSLPNSLTFNKRKRTLTKHQFRKTYLTLLE